MYGSSQGQPPGYAPAPMQPQAGKSGFVAMMLAIAPAMFGICGVHRMYTGHVGTGIAQFFTFGGCGIWQLIDIISIATGKFTDKQGQTLKKDHPMRKLM